MNGLSVVTDADRVTKSNAPFLVDADDAKGELRKGVDVVVTTLSHSILGRTKMKLVRRVDGLPFRQRETNANPTSQLASEVVGMQRGSIATSGHAVDEPSGTRGP